LKPGLIPGFKTSDSANAIHTPLRQNAAAIAAILAAHPQEIAVTTRTREETFTFVEPFSLKGIDRVLPPGAYRVVTDEELVEGLSFPVYRRIATMIFVPAAAPGGVEMITVDPADLQTARTRDVSPAKGPS
jgi:hypothetical protein